MKPGDFLKKLATKGGIPETDKNLVAALEALKDITHELPAEFVNVVDSSLMTIDAATAHPSVIKKIKAETLNGADATINKVLSSLGYDEADIADIKADTNTFTRIEKLVDKVKALESKKAGSNKDKDKAAFEKEIEGLNSQIRTIKEAGENSVKELTNKHQEQITDYEIRGMIASKKLSLPDDMPASLKNQTALLAIKNELQAKGFQIANKNGTLEVKKADGTDAYDDSNRKIDLTGFIDGALAQNKLLAVTDPNAPVVVTPKTPGSPDPVPVNQNALSIIEQSLADAGLTPTN